MALITSLVALLALGVQDSYPTTPQTGEDVAVVDTDKGKIVMMFYPQIAPNTVTNFKGLANSSFYDGTRFHRCIPDFMIQGGDPNSKDVANSAQWGMGGHIVDGAEKTVDAEFNSLSHTRGVVSMARSSSPNSASSQFFIVVKDSSFLDHQYTAFGRVVDGMDVADKIVLTGSKDPRANGTVPPDQAVVVKSVKIAKWPLTAVVK